MLQKYAIGTLVYSPDSCLGIIIYFYNNKHVKSKYVVEWDCRKYYRSYTEYEIDDLVENLVNKLNEE